jgi:FkbM family methyltransferase
MAFTTLQALVQRFVNKLGYKIEKLRPPISAPLDVFDLVVHKLVTTVPDFFFGQIGANDGITRDPVRKYVLKYRWRGLLVEPQPKVFPLLQQNYQDEKQLVFEQAAVAEKDGVARFFVADENLAPERNLTVFSSLNKDVLARCLARELPPGASRQAAAMRGVEVKALSVQGLLDKHRITRIDLLMTDTQGHDCPIVKQFLSSKVRPTAIHFEHLHTPEDELQTCLRLLVDNGYRCARLEIDTLAYLEEKAR